MPGDQVRTFTTPVDIMQATTGVPQTQGVVAGGERQVQDLYVVDLGEMENGREYGRQRQIHRPWRAAVGKEEANGRWKIRTTFGGERVTWTCPRMKSRDGDSTARSF